MVDGNWVEVGNGSTIGYKRMLRFPAVEATALKLTITQSRNTANIKKISAYCVEELSAMPDGQAVSDVQVDKWTVNAATGGTIGAKAAIDGDITTSFNSVWNMAMRDPATTAESWEEVILSTYPESYGAGYHNLNVSLPSPQSSFFFEYFSRYGTDYHDNPTDIEIYATNDADLFADVRASTTDRWIFLRCMSFHRSSADRLSGTR